MHDELDRAFNELWADNGDAISNEYAGTSALKVCPLPTLVDIFAGSPFVSI